MTEDYKPSAKGETRTLTWFSSRTYTWQPHKDISAYELALCVPLMVAGATEHGWMQMNSIYDALPAEAQRHWRVESSSSTQSMEVLDGNP